MIEGGGGGKYLTPQQIYEELMGGPGPETLSSAQSTSYDEASREAARADRIVRIGRTIQGGWQGSAAGGAFGAAAPLAEAATRGADDLYRAQDLLDRQNGSFGRAKNSVVPVPAGPPEMDVGDFMNPVDYEMRVRQYQSDAQHNMQVFEGYDNASVHNETYAPREYPVIANNGGTIVVTGGDTAGGGQGGTDGTGSGGHSGPNGGGTSGSSHPAGVSGPVGSLPGGQQTPGAQQTNPNNYVPPVTQPPGYQPPVSQPGPVTGPPGGPVTGVPVGGYPGGGGGGPGTGGGAGGRGAGGGGAAGGPGARGGGLGPGAGAGALAADEAARRGGPGVAGARGGVGAGPMGGAPMGGGRGKGEDDENHERKYLIEPDPEATYGSDVLTAPQVIGDDAYEDD